jgi:hypothetical protein
MVEAESVLLLLVLRKLTSWAAWSCAVGWGRAVALGRAGAFLVRMTLVVCGSRSIGLGAKGSAAAAAATVLAWYMASYSANSNVSSRSSAGVGSAADVEFGPRPRFGILPVRERKAVRSVRTCWAIVLSRRNSGPGKGDGDCQRHSRSRGRLRPLPCSDARFFW